MFQYVSYKLIKNFMKFILTLRNTNFRIRLLFGEELSMSAVLKKRNGLMEIVREFRRNGVYYLMAFPAILLVFLLKYLPMPGIVIAFKNYNFQKGIWGSPWAGLDNFKFFFTSEYAFRTTANTIWINLNYLFWGTLMAVTLAIVLNELRSKRAVKLYQNIMFLPYFFSAIIIGRIVVLSSPMMA